MGIQASPSIVVPNIIPPVTRPRPQVPIPAQPPLLDIAARSSFIQPPVIDMWSDLARRLDQQSTNTASKNVDGLFLEDLRKMCLEESTRTSPSSVFEPLRVNSSIASISSRISATPSLIQPNLLAMSSSALPVSTPSTNSRIKASQQQYLQQQQAIEDTNQGLLWQQLAGLSLEDILPFNRLHNHVNLKTR